MNARIRDRTFSNQSGSSSLASAFDERGFPSRSTSTNPLPSTSSSYSLATLSDSPQPRDRRQGPIDGVPPTARRQHHLAQDSDNSSSSTPRRALAQSIPTYSSTSTPPLASPSTSIPSLASRPILNPSYLPYTRLRVTASFIKVNDRNKEIISFLIEIQLHLPPSPSNPEDMGGIASWKVEKTYSDFLALDAAVKAKANRQERSGMGQLPDKSLFKDHAPHKSDQRKVSTCDARLQSQKTHVSFLLLGRS